MTITSEILMINLLHIWPVGAPSNWYSCPSEIPAAPLKTSLHKIFQVHFLGWEDPLEWQPTPVFLPGESHGQESGGL